MAEIQSLRAIWPREKAGFACFVSIFGKNIAFVQERLERINSFVRVNKRNYFTKKKLS